MPTSAHGTNPVSTAMCGYKIVAIKCDHELLTKATIESNWTHGVILY